MLLQQGQNGGPALRPGPDALQALQQTLKPGWTAHLTHDNRFYYCNHVTQTASWLPPIESWISNFPYGWEEALDHDGKPYYVNHLNKTTTYEDPRKDWSEEPPQPREVTLSRHPDLGFGFVAGSEKPVIVRFVTEGGPSVDLLQPGDQILAINGEDVKRAPRDHVIKLVRACKEVVHLTVCQPPLDNSARKSALLSAAKKAKLKCNPSRVRFAEGVVVNGSPLFPPSTFSNGEASMPVLPNVLKVYLENGQTKSFKYDSSTTVRDVVSSLLQKLCIHAAEHFSLVVEHFKSLRRNKLTLLDPNESVARIAARPGSHNLRCLFRVAFVPKEAAELAQKDMAAFEYLFMQCCNDVVQERYAPELKYDVSLRLAALHIHQHALAHSLAGKLTVKAVEREFGLERFVPVSLMGSMKRKELRKLLAHFLKLNQNFLPGQKSLTSFQAKLHYLNIVSELPSYGAKCFSTNLRDATMETVLLVSPKFGISQILGIRNSVPVALADIEDMEGLVVRREDELSRMVRIYLQNRELTFSLEDRDAEELVLVLQGYYHLLTGDDLSMDEERDPWPEDCAPHYLSPHAVRPTVWNYAPPCDPRPRIVNFSQPPPYHHMPHTIKSKMNGHISTGVESATQNGSKKCGVDGNMNIKNQTPHNYGATAQHDAGFDFQSVVSMEILQGDTAYLGTRNDEVLKRVAEMQALVMTSEQYLTEQQREQRDSYSCHSSPHLRHHMLSRLTEEEDSDSHMSSTESEIPPPGQLKHSDSLLLLTQGLGSSEGLEEVVEVVRSLDLHDAEPSESDTDSNSTPAGSPCHRTSRDDSRLSTQSFGLHSPDGLDPESADIQEYLKKLQDDSSLQFEFPEGSLYLDPDIIDLTAIPPPATPDDGVNPLPMQPSLPPTPFADTDREPAIYWGEEDQDSMTTTTSGLGSECRSDDLEAFLATVAVAAPAPAAEITPEEILSYIIPPPPLVTSPVCPERTQCVQSAKEETPLRSCLRRSSLDGNPPPRQNGFASFSPKSVRKGTNLCCTAPRASPDYELRPPKHSAPQVSDWPPRNGSLKLALLTGDGLKNQDCSTNYGTMPKPGYRAAADCTFGTLPKNCARNLDGAGQPSHCPKSSVVSVRSTSAANTSRDLPPPPTPPRNGVICPRWRADAPTAQWSPNRLASAGVQDALKPGTRREELLARSDAALAVLLVRLDHLAAQCDLAQSQGGGEHINEEKFQAAKDEVLNESCEMVSAAKNLVKRLTSAVTDTELADGCSCCLQHLRRLSERCGDMAAYTPSPLHTRNIVLRVHDVASAVRQVMRRPSAQTSEHLAGVLSSLLRSLRVFE